MKVVFELQNCSQCVHAVNTDQLHDDHYQGPPGEKIWYCNHDHGLRYLPNVDVIDPNCPINQGDD